ncbi:ornithine-acyl[acyl carrier protein] N-acyltransferase [Litoreibacter halocynthiae]|uniref:L-ornithine N(alpha)-acyltransferase n=1 Tax=Litoreibacter halocynthiae TaxID=1242689 RepID=A0A4R7LNQ7_9RHOB|nr:GNAT family N-acyltransferase [Litoreibacter halocynthiae]TDT77707.1 ornithine-acyl[acyl carrier protein] N-acyltransferase [Litoreibacter halocynthiae]
MTQTAPQFETRLAKDEADLRASQHLRYQVFVDELGGDGEHVDHESQLERDAFDPHFDHLILLDHARAASAGQVVGVYRLLRSDALPVGRSFYSEGEYDLGPLKATGRRLLELGRSCVHSDYRGGAAMFHLWQGLAQYIDTHRIEVLFGVASYHGTDVEAVAQSMSHLHHTHLAPPDLRPRALVHQRMDLVAPEDIDRPKAMKDTPALIKAYLRLGGMVGDGAFIDHEFNTIDVCLVMDTARMSQKHRDIYSRDRDSKGAL